MHQLTHAQRACGETTPDARMASRARCQGSRSAERLRTGHHQGSALGGALALGGHAEGPVRPLRALHNGGQLPRIPGLLEGRQVVGSHVQQRPALLSQLVVSALMGTRAPHTGGSARGVPSLPLSASATTRFCGARQPPAGLQHLWSQ